MLCERSVIDMFDPCAVNERSVIDTFDPCAVCERSVIDPIDHCAVNERSVPALTGECRQLQGSGGQLRHHPEAGGGREASGRL